MWELRKRTKKRFEQLEKMVKTSKRVNWFDLDKFFMDTRRDWNIQWQGVDQHTGGEEFVERWWHDYFVPRFDALKKAKVAQDRRMRRHAKK